MLDMIVGWNINLNTAQLNIVLRALRGVLRQEEIQTASDLANNLAKRRVAITKGKLAEISKLEENLDD